jgi:hypothetical protein
MGHGSHVSDNNPDVLEREKQRNLQGECCRWCVKSSCKNVQCPRIGMLMVVQCRQGGWCRHGAITMQAASMCLRQQTQQLSILAAHA